MKNYNRILTLFFFISVLVGQPTFTEHTISTSVNAARSVYPVDVDGDMDVFLPSSDDDEIAWHENDGSESFTDHAISDSVDVATSVYAVDVDDDGDEDMDVLSASWGDNRIVWYEQAGRSVQTTTYVPDDNFEQALIDFGYDDVLDDSVLTANISSVTSLDVGEKEISDLTGIAGFTALTNLSCDQNQLTSLDVSGNTALTYLYCRDNALTSLDVSNNTALTTLHCYRNQLTALDVSNNTALTTLNCYGSSSNSTYGVTNQITALDVSNNTALTYLHCARNQLTTLDVSNNTALTSLSCYSNQLTALDVSNNTALTYLNCDGSHPNTTTGVTNQITALDVSNNTALTSLYCAYNPLTTLDVSNNTALTSLNCSYQSLTELDVSNNTALTSLYCDYNQLTALDVSNNISLQGLGAADNDLTTFDVSNNTALTYLYVGYNALTSLDVSNNTALTSLYVHSNALTTFDVSNNTALTTLYVSYMDLTALDVSNNTALTNLNVSRNDLTTLDVSNNTALIYLYCDYNQLTALDVSNNTALTHLYCSGSDSNSTYGLTNQLTTLDVSNNTALTTLSCSYNPLTTLDVSNNTALTNLTCYYNQLNTLDVSNNTALTYLYCSYNPLTTLDVSNNTALTSLYVHSNALTTFDVSNNISLQNFGAANNYFTAFDVSLNTALTSLQLQGNDLTALDVSNNTALTQLYVNSNDLTTFDVSNNTALIYLYVGSNDLTTFDVSNNTALTTLYVSYMDLTALDVSNNTALTRLYVDGNDLTALDMSSNTVLTDLYCQSNDLTSLDVSNNTVLKYLYLQGNDLTALDVSNNTALTRLYVTDNDLTALDVSSNTALTDFYCYINQLTYLNMKNGVTGQLTNFNATSNDSLECIETLDPDYATTNWTSANGNIDEGVTFAVDCSSGPPPPPPPFVDNAFLQTYGGSESDYGYSVQQTSDGGYIITGSTESYGSGNADVWLIRTDANGDTLWTQTFGGSENDIGHSVQQSSDGGYIITGYTESYGSGTADVWLIKTDANGDTLWTQTFGGSENDRGYSVQQTSDDGYIITGYTSSYGNGGYDFWLIKTGTSGVLTWSKTFGGSESDGGHSVQQTSDDGYIITGYTSSYGSGSEDLWLVKTNFRGDSTWTQTIGGSSADGGHSVQQTEDGGYIITGTTNSYGNGEADVWLIKTDANGDSSWTQTFGGSDSDDGLSVQQTDDGGYIIAGTNTETPGNIQNGLLFKTDANGNEEWNQNFGLGGCESVQQTDDGGYIITGTDRSNSNNSDVWLIKTDASGNLYSPSNPLWYVATTGSDATGDGSEGNPFATIQTAINVSNDGDSVLVAAGTYVENIDYSGKNISIIGSDRETTIIDGNQAGSVVIFNNWENDTAHLSGFTLTNGLPNGAWPSSRGGAINCQDSSPTLSNLLITGNSSTDGGGGIYLYNGSDAKIIDVIIKDNIGGWGGGGMYIEGSDAELTNVQIHSNDDGGVKLQASDVYFDHVTISDNESYGMHIEYSAEPTFNHVTIVNNDTYGIGLYSTWSHPVITNSIIVNNGTQVTTNQNTGPYGISISYSNIQGGLDELDSLGFHPDSVNWGEGNIDADPLFCSTNSSLSFDGIDDYVDVGNVTTNFSSGLSVSAWVLYNSFSMWSRIIDFDVAIDPAQHNGILLANYDATNSLTFEVYVDGTSGGKVTAGDALSTGVWMHLVASMDNTGNVILYKDGIQIHSGTTSVPAVIDRPSSFIGRSNWSYDGYFDGSIDEVAIWNSSLTASEVNALYNSGNGLDASFNSGEYSSAVDLVHYWTFNEGTGTTLTDQTSSGNNGTINGSTWITDTPDMVGGYTLAENSPCVGSGQGGADMGAYGIGCPGIMPPIEIQNLQLTGTITGLDNEGFDIVGNRLYAIFPGTNNWADSASSLSIVDLNTLEILATGGEYSPTSSGMSGYPNRIEVFGNIAVVDGGMFFDVGGDVVQYLSGVYLPWSPLLRPVMHTYKRGNYLFNVLQSTGFGVYDMTDPLNPVTVYEHDYDNANDYPYGIYADDVHVFVTDVELNKIYIHAIYDSTFSLVGQIDNNYSHRVAVHGNPGIDFYHLYTSSGAIYDLSDTWNIVEIANHSGIGVSNGEMKIYEDYLLIAAGGYGSDWDSEARIYDISDYQNLELVAEFNDSLPSYDIDWAGGKVYVAFGSQGNTDTWTGSSGGKVQVYESGGPGMSIIDEVLPVTFNLYNAYPNPFNPVTTLRYDLPENGFVNIIIYDILGRRVKTLISQTQNAGHRSVQWNATNDYGKPVSAGVYLYQIQTGKHISTKKMVLLK